MRFFGCAALLVALLMAGAPNASAGGACAG